MRNKNLIEYIKKLKAKREENVKKMEDGTVDDFEIVQLKFENNHVIDTKLSHLYESLVEKVPEEKLEQLKQVVMRVFDSEEDYKSHEQKMARIKKVTSLRGILQHVPTMYLDTHYEEVIEGIENLLDDKIVSEVVEREESFIPKKINNTPEYPLTQIVENAKNSDKFKALSDNEKEVVSKQLDEINHLVTKSPNEYADAKRSFDNDFESLRNKVTRQYIIEEYNDPNKKYKEVFDLSKVNIEFSQKEDVTDNQEKIDFIKSFKFELSDATKKAILNVWHKMDEYNLCEAGGGGESDNKIYGFKKLGNARFELRNAIQENRFEELENLKNEYTKQLQYVRDMYEIVKKEINPTPQNMPGNQENIRTDFIPAEFKNDLPLNATYNGLFNAYEIVKSMNLTGEEFLNNPQKYLQEALIRNITTLEIDNFFAGKTFEQKTVLTYADHTERGYNVFGVTRMIDLLNKMETDQNLKQKNELFRTVMVGRTQLAMKDDLFVNKYFTNDREGTLANILLARDEDRDFAKLRPYNAKTIDRLHTIKAFDRVKYIKEKNILPTELYNNIKKFVSEAYKISIEETERYRMEDAEYDIESEKFSAGKIKKQPLRPKAPKISKETFVMFMQNVQSTVQQYLMLKNPLETDGIDKLMDILKDPTNAFEDLKICNEYKREMANLKNKEKPFEKAEKQAVKTGEQIIKNTRTSEKTYNKSADTILKELDKIATKINGENDQIKVQNLQIESVNKINELKLLQKNEIQKLQREYKAGKLPKDYIQERIKNIREANHNEKVALFDDGFDKEKYFQKTGLENLSKEEKTGIIASELERRQLAKEQLYKQLYLTQKGFIENNIEDIVDASDKINIIDVNEIKQPENDLQRHQQNDIREPIEVEEAEINTGNKNIDKVEIKPLDQNKVIGK